MTSRIAFVFGSNGPDGNAFYPLRYARTDASKMAAALGSTGCDFVVVQPSNDTSAADVLAALDVTAESCQDGDEFVCYFSGHGILLNGSLVLLWENTDLDRPLGTAIPISRIMTALAFCKAKNRLLILDCCHAGAAAGLLGLKSATNVSVEDLGITAENFVLLAASDRLESARELEALGGSFMTDKICEALTQQWQEADADEDGQISIQDLATALTRAAGHQNRTVIKVPTPYIIGRVRGHFYLRRRQRWDPWKVRLPHDMIATLIPMVRTSAGGRTLFVAVADRLVTNSEYRAYVNETGVDPPSGEKFQDGDWIGPFNPWEDDRYRVDSMPVVCVNVDDAQAYCRWLSEKVPRQIEVENARGSVILSRSASAIDLPGSAEWECAAFGHSQRWSQARAEWGWDWGDPRQWTGQAAKLHHLADSPATIDVMGERANAWGLSDLIGNVWEWCYSRHYQEDMLDRMTRNVHGGELSRIATFLRDGHGYPRLDRDYAVLGGGFLDDLNRIVPFLNAAELRDGRQTRHCDLGFRIIIALEFGLQGEGELAAAGGLKELLEVRNFRSSHIGIDGWNHDFAG